MNATLVAVRAVYFLATLQLFGWLIFDLFIGQPGWGRRAAPMAAIALVAMTGWLAIETNLMSGEPVSVETLGIVLRQTQFGTLWIWRAVLLVGLLILTLWPNRAATLLAATGAALVLIFDGDRRSWRRRGKHYPFDKRHDPFVGSRRGSAASCCSLPQCASPTLVQSPDVFEPWRHHRSGHLATLSHCIVTRRSRRHWGSSSS